MKRKLVEKKVHKYKGSLTKRALILTSLFLALIAISGVTIFVLIPKRSSKQPAPLPTAFATTRSTMLSRFMYLDYEDEFAGISKRRDAKMDAELCGDIFGMVLYQTLDTAAGKPNNFQILNNKIKEVNEQLSGMVKQEVFLMKKKIYVIKLFSEVLLGFKTLFSILMAMRHSVIHSHISGSFLVDIEIFLTHYSILEGIYKIKDLWTQIMNYNLMDLLYDKSQEENRKELSAVKSKVDYIFTNLLNSSGVKHTQFHIINRKNYEFIVEIRDIRKHNLYGLVYDYYLYVLIHLIFDGLYQTNDTESSESSDLNITVKEGFFKEKLTNEKKQKSLAAKIESIRKVVLVFKKLKDIEEASLFEKKPVFPSNKELESLMKFEVSIIAVLKLCEESWGN